MVMVVVVWWCEGREDCARRLNGEGDETKRVAGGRCEMRRRGAPGAVDAQKIRRAGMVFLDVGTCRLSIVAWLVVRLDQRVILGTSENRISMQ